MAQKSLSYFLSGKEEHVYFLDMHISIYDDKLKKETLLTCVFFLQ